MKQFDIVLINKTGNAGLLADEVSKAFETLALPEAYPVEITDPEQGDFSAMGFVTVKAAEELEFEYANDSDLAQFVRNVINGDEYNGKSLFFEGLSVLITDDIYNV